MSGRAGRLAAGYPWGLHLREPQRRLQFYLQHMRKLRVGNSPHCLNVSIEAVVAGAGEQEEKQGGVSEGRVGQGGEVHFWASPLLRLGKLPTSLELSSSGI